MAKIKSVNINPGDPVTAEVMSNIVADLHELSKPTTAAVISLTLSTSGDKQGNMAIASQVYSSIYSFTSKHDGKPQIKWDLKAAKFASPPRVWCQLVSKGSSYTGTEFKFMVQVLSVSKTQAVFEVRGTGFKDANFDLYVFAVEAVTA